MNNTRRTLVGDGPQTAALAFGGFGSSNSSKTEKYDGTSWTVAPDMATARRYLAGAGTQTAGLGFGGYSPSGKTTATEEFTDGTITQTFTTST